jgi:hypothetical protein
VSSHFYRHGPARPGTQSGDSFARGSTVPDFHSTAPSAAFPERPRQWAYPGSLPRRGARWSHTRCRRGPGSRRSRAAPGEASGGSGVGSTGRFLAARLLISRSCKSVRLIHAENRYTAPSLVMQAQLDFADLRPRHNPFSNECHMRNPSIPRQVFVHALYKGSREVRCDGRANLGGIGIGKHPPHRHLILIGVSNGLYGYIVIDFVVRIYFDNIKPDDFAIH